LFGDSREEGDKLARLLAAIGLSLALAAPALAQGDAQSGNDQSARVTQSGSSSQHRVIQQGNHTESDGSVSSSQTDNGDASSSQDDNCDPNYEGRCLHDGIGDYDCLGPNGEHEGDGPNFVTGPFRRVGDDPFDLDRNHDGIACERRPSGNGGSGDNGRTPRGGVDSGLGGMAAEVSGKSQHGSDSLRVIVGGALVAAAVLGGLGAVLRRRA